MIPKEIQYVIDLNLNVGMSRRVVHRYKTNGEVCTDRHKDPALSVKRVAEGYVFHCFRCGYRGFIGANKLPSRQVVAMIKKISERNVAEVEHLELPEDHICMVKRKPDTEDEFDNSDSIPIEAYTWLWDAGITDFLSYKYYLSWSPSKNRLIIPVIDEEANLVAYIGRNVNYDTNKDTGAAKYILRKQKGLDRRVYFTCHAVEASTVVIVEDALSAIRIHEATGLETVALLNTTVGTDLFHEYMEYNMLIWLDSNATVDAIKAVGSATSFGIRATHILTPKDPKYYNNVGIKSYIDEAREEIK